MPAIRILRNCGRTSESTHIQAGLGVAPGRYRRTRSSEICAFIGR